ncbi:hypothetical protein CMO93_01755 [Candidatus Woesearchaeota archaeon]|nr:hypothetical protein [Candidatus Woesearchaeota archaeon]
MFKLIYQKFQISTFFEKLLLIVGIAIGIVGFWFINTVYYENPTLSWQFLMAIFLWLLLIFVVILTDSNESRQCCHLTDSCFSLCSCMNILSAIS